MNTFKTFVRTPALAFSGLLALMALPSACSSSNSAPASPSDAGNNPATGDDAGVSGDDDVDAGHVVTPVADSAPPQPTADSGGLIVVDAGPACNALSPSAPSVNYSLSDQAGPAATTGGTVADGTYFLTNYTIYGAGSVGGGFTANQATSVTLVIAGTSWTQVQVVTIENTVSTVSSNFTAAPSGDAVTLTPSCPAGPAIAGTYTATDTALQLVTHTGGFELSELFIKQ